MAGIFNFGGLLDAINPGETRQRTFSAPVMDAINSFAPNLTRSSSRNTADIEDTRRAARDSANVLKGLETDSVNRATGVINRLGSFNPIDTYERIRTGNIASLDDLSKILTSSGRRASSLEAARLGYGGGRNSTYQDILREGRVAAAIAPVAGSIYNNLGRDTAGISGSELAALASVIPALQQRNSLVGRDVPYYALPVSMRDQTDANMVSALSGLANAARSNTAGFEYMPNKGARIGGALDSAINSFIDTAMSLYTGGAAGGGSSGGGIDIGGLMNVFRNLGGGRGATPTVFPDAMSAYYG